MARQARAIARKFSEERAWSRGETPANFKPYDSLLSKGKYARAKTHEEQLPEGVRNRLEQKRNEQALALFKRTFSKAGGVHAPTL